MTTLLAAVGVLHFVWMFSTWPLKDPVSFARTLIGRAGEDGLPSRPATAAVGLALLGAAVLTLMANDNIPRLGPDWLTLTGMYGLAAVMFLRGAGGYLMNSRATPEFRHWNSVLYSPLCLTLAALATTVAVSATRR
ncbi:DUF3995 domain-containing protein [Streptomyces durbertensis]|uniref:DUF3995 domain-containing protein n=1 Tax=Streptomyces durbertensis TaxID=2448886 RepID=A0ABR6EJ53_9ACTN|nr:DUF3995 domain-containing protein [Streptomyces durbertensis]